MDVIVVVDVVLIANAFLVNIVVLSVLFFRRENLLDNPVSFLRNLFLSELLISVISMLIQMDIQFNDNKFHQVTEFAHLVHDALLVCTNLCHMAINIDRYTIIRHPLSHSQIMSREKILAASIVSFTLPAGVAVLLTIAHYLLKTNPVIIAGPVTLVSVIATSVIVILTNCYIYVIVKRHSHRVQVPIMCVKPLHNDVTGTTTETSKISIAVQKTPNYLFESNRTNNNNNTTPFVKSTDVQKQSEQKTLNTTWKFWLNGDNIKNSTDTSVITPTSTRLPPFSNGTKRTKRTYLQKRAWSRMLLIQLSLLLSTSFIMCTIPDMVRIILHLSTGNEPSVSLYIFSDLFLNLNFIITPISIVLRNKKIYKELQNMIKSARTRFVFFLSNYPKIHYLCI